MNPFKRPIALALTSAGCLVALGTTSCKKKAEITTNAASPLKPAAAVAITNSLGALPGAVYRSEANSPIHWQPWTKETLNLAKTSNRLIFMVIAMPQQPGFQTVMSSLAADSAMVAQINEESIPIFVDGDAAREMSLLAADLCGEVRSPVQLPLFVWLSPEGNPVAWIPISSSNPRAIADFYSQSRSMVARMWADDATYVAKNSALDQTARQSRMLARAKARKMSEQPAEDTVIALRQLVSFYDVYSHTFDEAGGLFPSGALDLLAAAAVNPGLTPDLRNHCLEVTRALLSDLLPSAMFDPLEGGVFTSRRGNTWSLPVFYRDCGGQARAALALLNAYQASGDSRALEKALAMIGYAEKNFTTSDGLFAIGLAKEPKAANWLWSIDEIEKELGPEDAKWWIKATGMKEMGNLPSEADPKREFFRSNSIGLQQSLAETAAAEGQTLAIFAPRFENVRKKLLKARSAKTGDSVRDNNPHAGTNFRMVSAYAAAFGTTGEVAYRDKAITLLTKCRTAFASGPKLRAFDQETPKSVGAARAFIYGLAIQASTDVAVISSKSDWWNWSEDLAATASELFTENDYLRETPTEASIMDLPFTDPVMLFDDSSGGLIALAECRLAEQGRPMIKALSDLATPLPAIATERPVLFSDLLYAALARNYKITVSAGSDLSPELMLALERLNMRQIQRRPAKATDAIPAGSIKITLSDGKSSFATTPNALRAAVLPADGKL
jgi:uncharacterized protein